MRYQDYSIRLSQNKERLELTVKSPAGSSACTVLPLVLRSKKNIGRRLYQHLFSEGKPRELLEHSLGMVWKAGEGLRIILEFATGTAASSKLESLPWELMERDGFPLALDPKTPILRRFDVPRPIRQIAVKDRLRILVLAANPHQATHPLDLAKEIAALRDLATANRNLELHVHENAACSEIGRACDDVAPHILHFMGHAGFNQDGRGILHFEDSPIDGFSLAVRLQSFDSLGVVVLNGCRTASRGKDPVWDPFAGVASSLARAGLPAVIAMLQNISDPRAILFARQLYHHLARGKPIEAAVTEGRLAMSPGILRPSAWSIPALYFGAPVDLGPLKTPSFRMNVLTKLGMRFRRVDSGSSSGGRRGGFFIAEQPVSEVQWARILAGQADDSEMPPAAPQTLVSVMGIKKFSQIANRLLEAEEPGFILAIPTRSELIQAADAGIDIFSTEIDQYCENDSGGEPAWLTLKRLGKGVPAGRQEMAFRPVMGTAADVPGMGFRAILQKNGGDFDDEED